MDLLNHPVGIISIVIFIIAYAFVMTEEVTHLRKSKPVLFAAGIIWAMIAWVGVQTGDSYAVKKELMHCLLYTSPSPRDRYISRMPSSA